MLYACPVWIVLLVGYGILTKLYDMKINQTKKNTISMLATALGLCVASQANSESYSDLLVGFTTQSGSDVIYDIGALSGLTDGETWSAGTLGISVGSVNNYKWGVIGDDYSANQSVLNNTLWTTAPSLPGILINGSSKFNSIDSSIATLYATILANTVTSYTIVATDVNSWNSQTISGALTTQYHNAYLNPNASGVSSIGLYQITDQNSLPVRVGTFSLGSGGTLTFNLHSAQSAPVASFSAQSTNGFAPLTVQFNDNSTGVITNWVWNFGNNKIITNNSSATVTNTYAAAGNYTVTLLVYGPGGSTTNVMNSFIKTYSQPQLGMPKMSNGSLTFLGTNCPPGIQYRIVTSTNVATALAGWTPVWTNTFSLTGGFAYTNLMTNKMSFYRLVSP